MLCVNMRRRTISVALGAALLVVVGVSIAPRLHAQPSSGICVVTTTTVLADLVRQVGNGRLADVQSVVPSGVDVEDYNPTPGDLRAVANSNLFVQNGLALDRWAPKLIEAAQPGMPTLILSDGLPTLGQNESGDEDIGQNGNPHFWLDPNYTKIYVQRIHDALVAQDPNGAPTYDANTASYEAQLDDLDAWIRTQVSTLPVERRKLVTFHEAYPYFAARYGFELVGVITPSPGQEPSAGELAALVARVKAAQVPAVFSEAQFSPRLTDTLAAEAGVSRVVTDLYNDSLGNPPADTYLGMMRYNVERIVEALS
jgi:manganese/iron transport system substrate-binding protein